MKELLKFLLEQYGVVVSIPTVSGISPYIANQGKFGKYCSLTYNSGHGGFIVSTTGTYVTALNGDIYVRELETLLNICKDLNKCYVPIP